MSTRADLNQGTRQLVYDEYLARQLRNTKQFLRFGMEKSYKSKGSDGTLGFKKYPRLSVADTALTEGTTPSVSSYTATRVDMTPKQYGSFVKITDLAMDDDINDEKKAAIDNISDQASRTINIIHRDELIADGNDYYANNVSTIASIVTSISTDDLDNIVAFFGANNVMYLTDAIKGSNNDNTTPVEPAYIGICHPHVSKDVRKLTDFIYPASYGASGKLYMEVGAVGNVRFVEDSECEININSGGDVGTTSLRSTGGSKVDLYTTQFIGKDAYCRVSLNNKNVEVIIKELGSAGTADPLNQNMTVGWKARVGTLIMYAEKLINYYSGATA